MTRGASGSCRCRGHDRQRRRRAACITRNSPKSSSVRGTTPASAPLLARAVAVVAALGRGRSADRRVRRPAVDRDARGRPRAARRDCLTRIVPNTVGSSAPEPGSDWITRRARRTFSSWRHQARLTAAMDEQQQSLARRPMVRPAKRAKRDAASIRPLPCPSPRARPAAPGSPSATPSPPGPRVGGASLATAHARAAT